MARFHTIYKITNLVNDKIYIGKHSTDDLDDDYMGSGKLINLAILKYGLSNFQKEILEIIPNEEIMNRREKEIVNEEFCVRSDNYNLIPGGTGSWFHINRNKEQYILKSIETVNNWSDEYRQNVNSMKVNSGDRNGMFGKDRSGANNPRFGIMMSDETKSKISAAAKGRQPNEVSRHKMSESQKTRWTDEARKERSDNYKSKGHKPPSPKGMLWWNNGTTVIRSAGCPGQEWTRGRKVG